FYGAHQAPRQPFLVAGGGLWELPVATAAWAGQRLPIGGGGYWRLAPLAYTHWGLRRALAQGLRPICYLHPWELDPQQPRVALPLGRRLRHYVGLGAMEARLAALLRHFGSRTVQKVFDAELGGVPAGVPA
ncbi:MAG: DUF3473 domain-containing protein, partial [Terriglobales bacterium]